MSKFIWIRDRDKREHFVNVDHIVRVTSVPSNCSYGEWAYIVMNEGGSGSQKTIDLSRDDFDTYKDVIGKIQMALV